MKKLIGLVAISGITACGGTAPEAKTAADVPPQTVTADAYVSASDTADAGLEAEAATETGSDGGADAYVPDAPPAPEAAPPSSRPAIIQVVWDGLTREVTEGETFNVDGDDRRQLFFYSTAAAPDCSNVVVVALEARSMAGLCQIGFLPLEQKFARGEERAASISVIKGGTATTPSFRVARR